jgi:hypothetical protein
MACLPLADTPDGLPPSHLSLWLLSSPTFDNNITYKEPCVNDADSWKGGKALQWAGNIYEDKASSVRLPLFLASPFPCFPFSLLPFWTSHGSEKPRACTCCIPTTVHARLPHCARTTPHSRLMHKAPHPVLMPHFSHDSLVCRRLIPEIHHASHASAGAPHLSHPADQRPHLQGLLMFIHMEFSDPRPAAEMCYFRFGLGYSASGNGSDFAWLGCIISPF